MNDFMRQAHAVNRFINTLSDHRDLIGERVDIIRAALSDIDITSKVSEDVVHSVSALGIQIDVQNPSFAFKQLQDELRISVYEYQFIEAQMKEISDYFSSFFSYPGK